MRHLIIVVWGVTAALAITLAARADCVRDAECDSGMICEAGECVEPPPAAADVSAEETADVEDDPGAEVEPAATVAEPPASGATPPPTEPVDEARRCEPGAASPAAPAPTPEPAPAAADWFTKYATVAGLWGFFGWGELYDPERSTVRLGVDTELPDDATEITWSAFQMTALGAFNENFHLGGFFTYLGIEERSSAVSFGVTAKLGGRVDDRVWLGLALDAGMLFWVRDEERYEDYWGVVVFPRFHVDVVAIRGRGGFKLGFFAAIGPHFVPYTAGTMIEVDPGVDVEFSGWNANLTALMGMSLGG